MANPTRPERSRLVALSDRDLEQIISALANRGDDHSDDPRWRGLYERLRGMTDARQDIDVDIDTAPRSIADEVKACADEWYEYPGSEDEQKPAYWVARHGRVVTSQIEDDEAEAVELDSVERARAEFADATCDPDGPGAPQRGDLIRVFWGEAQGDRFTVASATTEPPDGGWTASTVTGNESGRPVVLTLGQFVIESRPVGVATWAAEVDSA